MAAYPRERNSPSDELGLQFSARDGILELGAQDEVGDFLRLRCGLHDELVVVLQCLQPVLEVGGGILNRVFDAGMAAEKRRTKLRDKFLPAIRIRAEALRFCERGAIQP